ncbi:MAG TPA: hypothetical protein DIC42_06410 [Holosporales bacterium]|nr:hypothetical protein [Holosporales bacterium]
MNQSENKKIEMEIPRLSKALKNPIEKRESNTQPQVKQTSFIFIMISGLVISLGMLIVIVASVKVWRPKLFPEIQTIQHLETDMNSLNQTIVDLHNDTKSKQILMNEIASLKQEIDQIKTDMQIEIAVLNNKINTLIFEQNNNKTTEPLDNNISADKNNEISMDASVFYAQFLAALAEDKPLLKFYEHAGKLNLSDEFKDIIANIRKINFEKIKSNEELLAEFDQMQRDILKDTMVTSNAQKGKNGLIKSITGNIQIRNSQQPNRMQLKKDFIKAKRLFDQDDVKSAIDILKSYAHHKDVDNWIKHAKEKIEHDEAIQNVRKFKGPYSQ